MRESKHLLGHQKCTFKSKKQNLYIYEMRTFDLWHLDLVENNIPVLHSLRPEWVQKNICKSSKKNFGKKSLIVTNVKLLSKFFFNIFGFFMPYWWQWQLAIYMLSVFPTIRNLSSLNDLYSLNDLSGLNGLNSLISSKNLLSMMLTLIWQQNNLSWSLNVEWIIKNPLFYGFLALFQDWGCGGQGCYFQPNPSVISQMSASNEFTDTVFMN